MITVFRGRRGSGKTTSMVRDAYLYHLRGWYVVTNMGTLGFANKVLPNDEILDLLESEFSNFVIVIDEIQTFIDSRRSMRGENVNFAYFIQQIRKRNIHILATTQFLSRVDKAFREHIDVIASPEFIEEYPVCIVRYLDRTIVEEEPDQLEAATATILYDPRPVYELFDTTEVITPLQAAKRKKLDGDAVL